MYSLIENNASFIVVYKNPGAGFHREGEVMGLFETVKKNEGLEELFPVHRLDKVTSGLLVMAKSAAANQALVTQFSERTVEKYYLAISDKKPKKKQGLISGDMEPARRSAWKLMPTQKNPAISQFFSLGMGAGKRLFVIKPHTGKTHQIRVALKSLGAPILGDTLYGGSGGNTMPGGKEEADRTYLHAYSLAFSMAGTQYRFKVLPREGEFFLGAEFLTAIKSFEHPQDLPWPRLQCSE